MIIYTLTADTEKFSIVAYLSRPGNVLVHFSLFHRRWDKLESCCLQLKGFRWSMIDYVKLSAKRTRELYSRRICYLFQSYEEEQWIFFTQMLMTVFIVTRQSIAKFKHPLSLSSSRSEEMKEVKAALTWFLRSSSDELHELIILIFSPSAYKAEIWESSHHDDDTMLVSLWCVKGKARSNPIWTLNDA